MVCRIKSYQIGVVDYLIFGKKKDRKESREELDYRRIIAGDYQLFSYLNEQMYKSKIEADNESSNYINFAISFNEIDQDKLTDDIKDEIVKEYIKFYTSGYEEEELVYLAEEHIPKIKYDKNGNLRKHHIHLSILKQNLLTGKGLDVRPFSLYTDKLFTTYLNRKYGLSNPTDEEFTRKSPITRKNILARFKNDLEVSSSTQTKIARARKLLKELLENVDSREEIFQILEAENIKYREVKGKRGNYLRVKIGDVEPSLRGADFKNIEKLFEYESKTKKSDLINELSFEELERRINEIHNNRVELYSKRLKTQRTKMVQKELKGQLENDSIPESRVLLNEVTQKNIFSNIFQNKLYKEIYNIELEKSLKGYYIRRNIDESISITNKKEEIEILDSKNRIETFSKTNFDKNIELMIETAIAKGWNLEEIEFQGEEIFIEKSKKAITKKLKELNRDTCISISDTELSLLESKTSILDQQIERAREVIQKLADIDSTKAKDLNSIPVALVLKKVKEQFKVKTHEYELLDDTNRIRRVGTKLKGKSNLDFLQKEINLAYLEAKEILKTIVSEEIKSGTDKLFKNDERDAANEGRTAKIESALRETRRINIASKSKLENTARKSAEKLTELKSIVRDNPKIIKRAAKRRRERRKYNNIRRAIGRVVKRVIDSTKSRISEFIKELNPINEEKTILDKKETQKRYIDEQGDKIPSFDEALKVLDNANQEEQLKNKPSKGLKL